MAIQFRLIGETGTGRRGLSDWGDGTAGCIETFPQTPATCEIVRVELWKIRIRR